MPRNNPTTDLLWNLLTILALLSTCALTLIFGAIYINPNSSFNPLPPPTLPAILQLPTATETPVNVLPPTWTPAPTNTPQPTFTPPPTSTPQPTATVLILPTLTDTPTPTETPRPNFLAQAGSPAFSTSSRGCSWLGVAGQVLMKDGTPAKGYSVLLGGEYEGKAVKQITIAGAAPQYGEAGYEFSIADDPGRSKGTLYVQVIDKDGTAISRQISFETFDDCNKNLILITFIQQ
ncbi:MAG: hypothetical protein OHK0052_19540 [Anaerolineales bacterium]